MSVASRARLLVTAAVVVITSTAYGQVPETGLSILASTGATTGGSQYEQIDAFVSINADGTVAYSALAASLGWMVKAVPIDGPEEFVTSTFPPSTSRVFAAPIALSKSSPTPGTKVVCREVLSGTPPKYYIRQWVDGQAPIILGESPMDFNSASFWLDARSSGQIVYSALIGSPSTSVLRTASSSNTTTIYQASGNLQLRPQMSESGRVVYRDAQAAIRLYTPATGTNTIQAMAFPFTSIGEAPGIDATGTFVGFAGDRGNGRAVFLAVESAGAGGLPSSWDLYSMAGEDGYLSNVTIGKRVGVASSATEFGTRVATVLFEAERAGVLGLYTAQLVLSSAATGDAPRVLRAKKMVQVGEPIGGSTAASFFLNRPLNASGEAAFVVATSNGARHVLRYKPIQDRYVSPQPVPYLRFKQFDDKWINKSISGDGNGAIAVEACKGGKAGTYGKEGCLFAAVATAVGALATANGVMISDVDPEKVQGFLEKEKVVQYNEDYCGGFIPAAAHYSTSTDAGSLALVRFSNSAGGFDNLVTHLRNGGVAILKVPRGSADASNNLNGIATGSSGGHFILAYGYSQNAGIFESQSIQVSDPGGGTIFYGLNGEPGFVPGVSSLQKNEATHVTLHDYFAALSRLATSLKPKYFGAWGGDPARDDMRIREWFDHGVFYYEPLAPIDVAVTAAETTTKNLITYGSILISSDASAPPPATPAVLVASPVEVSIEDVGSGARYVSSASFAQPGDIVLDKVFYTPVGDPNGPFSYTVPVFPPYLVELPAPLSAGSAIVTVHGVGTGPYEVALLSRDPFATSPLALSGQASVGSAQSFSLSFTPANCFTNPGGSLQIKSGNFALGQSVVLGTQNPILASGVGSYAVTYFSLAQLPTAPCGIPFPGFGMGGGGGPGAVLVDLAPTLLIPAFFLGTATTPQDSTSYLPIALPATPQLAGLKLHAQSLLVDPSPAAAAPIGLSNAITAILSP